MTKIIVDDKELLTALKALAKKAGNLRPAMRSIGSTLQNRVKLGFSTGKAPDGTAWKPLKFRDGEPLRDKNILMNSITYAETDTSVDVGTNVCYAPTHQFGATIEAGKGSGPTMCGVSRKNSKTLKFRVGDKLFFAKKVTVPARPFLPTEKLPETWGNSVLDIVKMHLAKY